LLGDGKKLSFKQDDASLQVQLPIEKPTLAGPYVLKLEGNLPLGAS